MAGSDGFITKFNSDAGTLLFSTFLGSPSLLNGSVQVSSIAVDAAGVINTCGTIVNSPDFPVTPNAAYKSGLGFLSRLSPDASALTYSTPLPFQPSGAMALDSTGRAYVLSAGTGLIAIDSSGGLGYYSADAQGTSLIVLGDGTAVVGGSTYASNFPTRDTLFPCGPNLPPQTSFSQGETGGGTLMTIDPSGRIAFSILLGGAGSASVAALALDPAGFPFLVNGTTGGAGVVLAFVFDLSLVPHGLPAPSCLVDGAGFAYAPATPGMISTLLGVIWAPAPGCCTSSTLTARCQPRLAGRR